MVTTRQVVRGFTSTMRAIDRDAQRAARRRMAYEKAAQKAAILEAAADAAAEYQDMIEQLVGAHRVALSRMDWRGEASRPLLPSAEPSSLYEDAARAVQIAYAPGWFARTFGLAGLKRKALERAVQQGAARDAVDLAERREHVAKTNAEIEFAKRLTALDRDAVVEVLGNRAGLGNLPFCLEEIDVFIGENGRVLARVDGLDLEDMPTQSVTLLQSGKASVKVLPRARVLELHRDNICAASLRVAVAFLNVLPVDAVGVEMLSDVLDPATGHIEARPVVRVRVAAQAVEALNLFRAEPTAVIERLGGEMLWNKRDGFRPLEAA